MAIIIFILILSILVLIHEFGHFIVAKKNGVRVEEFGLGLPPRVVGKKIGETIYSFNLLPFGGFVKLTGEDFDTNLSTQDPRSFAAKSPLQRIAILVAGVSMNLLLAFLLFYVYFFFTGFKTSQFPLFFDYKFRFGEMHRMDTVVADIQKSSPAEKAGLRVGDAILQINGQDIHNITDVKNVLKGLANSEVTILVQDLSDQTGRTTRTVKAVPVVDEKGNTILGVYLSSSVSISYSKPLEKLLAGPLHAYNMMAYSNVALVRMIKLSYATHDIAPVSESVSGPVGIYQVVKSILTYGGPSLLLTLLDYIALMSLSLGFINILPFPALDGGRAAFVLYELISRRKVNPLFESKVHTAGMLLLLSLIALITVKDIFF